MSRLFLEKGGQRRFLIRIREEKKLNTVGIALLCKVCDRTIRDWVNEKFKIQYEAALILQEKTGISLPPIKKVMPEYWHICRAAKKGALKRYKIYGNPGTTEGRRKGGLISQAKFRADPVYATNLGVKVRKNINHPKESELLSEFMGIMLGDGGVYNYQVKITLNKITDRSYFLFVKKIIKKLFYISPSIAEHNFDKGIDLVISSIDLVEYLIGKGLKQGSKIDNKASIPYWIFKKKNYKIACLRGLIDTDGSFYSYKHKVNGITYCNFSMCFTNHSTRLLADTYKILKELEFKPTRCDSRIYLYKKMDIIRYFDIISPHNPKHIEKYKKWIYGGVPKWT